MSNYKASDVQTAATVASEVEREKEAGFLDWAYIRGMPAVVKGLEAVLTLIAYICVETSNYYCVKKKGGTEEVHKATFGYFKFVSLTAFATVMILYGLRLFKLHTRLFRCACVNWPFVELCYYGTVVVFFVFADLFLSIHGCHGSHKAGAAFGWFALAVFVVDLVFAGMEFRRSRNAGATQMQNPAEPSYDADRY